MVKAWLIVFLFSYNTEQITVEDSAFVGKLEIPFKTMEACSVAKTNLTMESEDIRYRFICVTNDHYTGKKQDPGVPLD